MEQSDKNIFLILDSQQFQGREDLGRVHLETEASLSTEDDMIVLHYVDRGSDQRDQGAEVYLKIAEGEVYMLRVVGDHESVLRFQAGRSHRSYYATPYGPFSIEVISDRVEIDCNERSGTIEIEYFLLGDSHEDVLKTHLKIHYHALDGPRVKKSR